ncbi:ZnMc domain-containing protein [Mycena chlorophos]|uniref:ZnMc domain-containing protein n=1 Tax=Mycena chlorophos TaxID=658473 RepID=A0A8H6W3R5_MYCCL|nr:ZnMc domain-containing protein [Mycena chlorophos]
MSTTTPASSAETTGTTPTTTSVNPPTATTTATEAPASTNESTTAPAPTATMSATGAETTAGTTTTTSSSTAVPASAETTETPASTVGLPPPAGTLPQPAINVKPPVSSTESGTSATTGTTSTTPATTVTGSAETGTTTAAGTTATATPVASTTTAATGDPSTAATASAASPSASTVPASSATTGGTTANTTSVPTGGSSTGTSAAVETAATPSASSATTVAAASSGATPDATSAANGTTTSTTKVANGSTPSTAAIPAATPAATAASAATAAPAATGNSTSSTSSAVAPSTSTTSATTTGGTTANTTTAVTGGSSTAATPSASTATAPATTNGASSGTTATTSGTTGATTSTTTNGSTTTSTVVPAATSASPAASAATIVANGSKVVLAATTNGTVASESTPATDAAAAIVPGTSTLGFNSFPTGDMCMINIPTTDVDSATSTEAVVGTVVAPTSAAGIATMIKTRLSLFWDVGATITYAYAGGSMVEYVGGSQQQQAIVDTVLAEWFRYANVQFQRIPNTPADLCFSFVNTTPSYSALGTINTASTVLSGGTINLANISSNNIPTDSDRATILHVTGHMLGLIHEHRSPLNGGSLTLDGPTVISTAGQVYMDQTSATNQIINVYNQLDLTNYDMPDHNSIMKYFGSSPTVTPPSISPPNFDISEKDKAFLVLVYPRRRPLNTAPEWTLDRALRVFEVDAATAATIKAAYDADQYTAGRAAFITFLINKRFGLKAPDESKQLLETGTEEVVDMEHWKTCAIAIQHEDQEEEDVGIMAGTAARAVITKLSELWDPSTPITYSFLGGTAIQQAKVSTVIQQWFYANITFTPVPSNGMIRIAFNSAGGSWSYVGTQASAIPLAQATMNLGWVTTTPAIPDDERGTILHEFGHVLGMMHEHQSPARGKKLTLDEGAVYSYYGRTQGWDRATIKAQIIDTYSADDVSNYSALDTTSIMMYFMPPEMNLQHTNVPVNNNLSDMDKAYMVINYPGQTKDAKWTLAYALQVAGVTAADASTSKAITDAAAKGNVTLVRTLFTAFQAEMRARKYADLNPTGVANGVDPTVETKDEDMGWCNTLNKVQGDAGPAGVAHGVAADADLLWLPGQTLYYGFLRGSAPGSLLNPETEPTRYRRQRVQRVLDLYTQYSSIKFKPYDLSKLDPNAKEGGTDVFNCSLRIAFGKPAKLYEADDQKDKFKKVVKYGWASVGTVEAVDSVPHWYPTPGPRWATCWLSMQPASAEEEAAMTPWERANANQTLYHELLHVLGFEHEHATPSFSFVMSSERLFGAYTFATAYDEKSVMLYSGIPLVIGGTTGLNTVPSKTDLALLRLMYPDVDSEPTVDGTMPKFNAALRAFGFSVTEIKRLQQFVDQVLIDPTEITTLRAEVAGTLNNHTQLANWDLPVPLPFGPVDLTSIPNPVPAQTINPDGQGGGRRRRGRGNGGASTQPSNAINPGGAQNSVDPSRALQAVQSESAPGFLYQLVDSLKQFFNPGGNQMFTLQFPGRYLDLDSYAWDTSSAGIYGQFIKPTAVNEAEFRLVDQLYDLQDVVVGPNGQNLSLIYDQLLNNFLPKFVDNGLFKQQDQIRQWMLKDVPMTQWIRDIMERQNSREQTLTTNITNSVNALAVASAAATSTADRNTTSDVVLAPGAAAAVKSTDGTIQAAAPMFDLSSKDINGGETLNRIELSELLMNEYLYAKQDWELERDTMITNATQFDLSQPDAQFKLNALTRQLAHITDTRQAQLASKYSDAVVRGYSHTIRRYMGYLDIKDPAESLQDAKDSFREAAMSSLDGSMNVYPVQMTPLDWFEGLSTSFTMEDLTQDVDLIRTQIDFKSSELDSLNAQLVALQMNSRGDSKALEKQVQDAQTTLDQAQGELASQFSNNVIELAKTYLDAQGNLDVEEMAEENGFAVAALAMLPEGLAKVQQAQNSLTSASRALSTVMAAQALAEATDSQAQQKQISMRVQSLTGELRELQARWRVLTADTGGIDVNRDLGNDNEGQALDPDSTLELPPDTTSGGSRWQTVMFTYDSKAVQQMSKQDAKATSNAWSCNVWFASASGGASSSYADAQTSSTATSSAITIAFRATLVTVDRGGWFQPQFFQESKAFYKVNPNITWNDGNRGLMRGYPIGYLIVKDVTIRIVHSETSSADQKRAEQESSAASGGFLCFSYSQSSSSSSSATASSFSQYSNGYIVRIPGPQILGYMMQKLDTDETTPMPAQLPDNFFIPDDEYNNAVAGGGAENGVNPAHGVDPNAPTMPEPTITASKMKEMLDRVLNEKIGELFGEKREAESGKGKEKRGA